MASPQLRGGFLVRHVVGIAREGLGFKGAPEQKSMYPAGNLFVPTPEGRLEAILKEPRGAGGRGAALVLHPHPMGGGTMHNRSFFGRPPR